MTPVRRYVQGLSEQTMRQILVDYEEFERTGVTGGTLLRIHVQSLMDSVGARTQMAVWSQMLVLEIWRCFACIHDPTLGDSS